MIEEFELFCEKYCAHKDNDPKEHLEPCVNCPAESFADIIFKLLEEVRGKSESGPLVKTHKQWVNMDFMD